MRRLGLVACAVLLAGCANLMEAELAAQAEADRTRREAFLAEHDFLPDRHQAAIRRGVVLVGMMYPEVEAAWGPPTDRHRTRTATVLREAWVYRWPSGRLRGVVYLERGEVVAVED